jgi:outer membrane protein
MRKNYFLTLIAATALLVSCGEDKKTEEVKTETAPVVQTVDTKGLKIAYYQMDSLKNDFTYYKKEEERINKKSKMYENTLMSRQKALMTLNQKYQQRLQSGQADPSELTKLEENLQRQDRQLQVYQQEEGMKIQEEANTALTALSKKIDVAAEKYCKKYGIDILLTHGAGGQISFINKKMDVTKSFIEFLNKEQSDLEKDMGQ